MATATHASTPAMIQSQAARREPRASVGTALFVQALLAEAGEIIERREQSLESLTKCHQARIGLPAVEHRSLGNAIELGELSLERSAAARRIEVTERFLEIDHGTGPRHAGRQQDCCPGRPTSRR